jgi:hypothetical protein
MSIIFYDHREARRMVAESWDLDVTSRGRDEDGDFLRVDWCRQFSLDQQTERGYFQEFTDALRDEVLNGILSEDDAFAPDEEELS